MSPETGTFDTPKSSPQENEVQKKLPVASRPIPWPRPDISDIEKGIRKIFYEVVPNKK